MQDTGIISKNNIPRQIHQIWFQGINNLPKKFNSNIDGVIKNHPEWSYKIWNDEELREECSKYSIDCLKKYDSFEHLHQKVDFGKYVILYNHGGAYIDMDCISLKALDTLPGFGTKDLIVSYNPCNFFENTVPSLSFNRKVVNNGVILSSPGNKYMKDVVDRIIYVNKCRFPWSKSLCIQDTTGPIQFTKSILRYENDPRMLILDCSYLEPCYGKDPYCKVKENSYINHKHEASWFDSSTVDIMPYYFFVKHYFCKFLVLIIIFIIVIFLGKIYKK